MASRKEFIQSIQPGMKLDKLFFLNMYGYEISYPGFREQAIGTLEAAGCSKARQYYDDIVGEYQRQHEESIRPVAAAYVKECDEKWKKKMKEGEEQRKQKAIQLLEHKRTLLTARLLQLTKN